eukprot:TRINITY_DN14490_c0_g3_i1.p3 TRINITY_DN14490_c0_g3~~TRINITY_DN14490_c0_g3_i1.p3  ORF type:complete len:204 (-),score=36.96 TRINITY_DN14490_c0_g3_i1:32-643(-)
MKKMRCDMGSEFHSVLDSPEMMEIKKDISKIFLTCFKVYTEGTIMEYNLFIKFCRDFEIFPEHCNKAVLQSLFDALCCEQRERQIKLTSEAMCRVKASREKAEALKSGKCLDKERFLDAVMLCSFKSKLVESQLNPVARVLHFLEKLVQSNGIAETKRLSGKIHLFADMDPLFEVREKYGEHFKEASARDKRRKIFNKVFGDI